MSTAVISVDANTDHFAPSSTFPGTIEQYSAQDSTMDGDGGVDNRHLSRVVWDYGDGTFDVGLKVGHIFASAGTHTVQATVFFTDGSSSTATRTTTTTTAPTFGFSCWVASSGNGGSDTGHNGSIGQPFLTLNKAFDSFRGSGAFGSSWGVIYVNAGDAIDWTFSGSLANDPDHGPLLIAQYGAGAVPTIHVTFSGGPICGWERHSTSWGRGIYLWNLHFDRPTPTNDALALCYRGSQAIGVSSLNMGFTVQRLAGTGDPHEAEGNSFLSCSFNYSLGRYGLFGSAPWVHADTVSNHANGSENPFAHQFYFSAGCTYLSVLRCTADNSNSVDSYAGIKTSLAGPAYLAWNECMNGRVGFDIGSNSDDVEGVDHVFEHNYVHNEGDSSTVVAGFYTGWGRRYVVRNNIVAHLTGGGGQGAITVQGTAPGHPTVDFDCYHNTFFANACAEWQQSETQCLRLTFRNNLCYKLNGQNVPFVKQESSGLNATATIERNLYFNAGAVTFPFVFDGTNVASFAAWQVASGQDATSIYGQDPKLVDPSAGDFRLLSSSPAIDAGLSLGLRDDYAGNPRVGTPDVGAYEYGQAFSGSGSGALGHLGASGSAAVANPFSGSGTGAFGNAAGVGAATEVFQAAGTGAFRSLGASGTGGEPLTCTGVGVFQGIGAAGLASVSSYVASGVGVFSGIGAIASAAVVFAGAGVGALRRLFANADGVATEPSTDQGGGGDVVTTESPLDRVVTLLEDLFPPGLLYRARKTGTLYQLRSAMADEALRLREHALELLNIELDPAKTQALLRTWEARFALPSIGSVSARRAALVAKVFAIGGQSPAYFIAIAERLGYEASIEVYDRLRCDFVCGDTCADWPVEFDWTMHATAHYDHHARAGTMVAGDRIGYFDDSAIEAAITAVKPAETLVDFAYDL
jgi:uncharacterized protein YmfQ (DUF2313 family)